MGHLFTSGNLWYGIFSSAFGGLSILNLFFDVWRQGAGDVLVKLLEFYRLLLRAAIEPITDLAQIEMSAPGEQYLLFAIFLAMNIAMAIKHAIGESKPDRHIGLIVVSLYWVLCLILFLFAINGADPGTPIGDYSVENATFGAVFAILFIALMSPVTVALFIVTARLFWRLIKPTLRALTWGPRKLIAPLLPTRQETPYIVWEARPEKPLIRYDAVPLMIKPFIIRTGQGFLAALVFFALNFLG